MEACSSESSGRKRRDKRESLVVHRQGCFTERVAEKLCGFIWQNKRDMEERDRRKTVTRGRRENQKKAGDERLGLSLLRFSGSWLKLTLIPTLLRVWAIMQETRQESD